MDLSSPRRDRRGMARLLVATTLSLLLCGCTSALQPLAAAMVGGAIGHTMNGVAYRTFTAPLAAVKAASLDSLGLMGIRVDEHETTEENELIYGSANRRTVELELEPISPRATRLRVVARDGGLFYDSATATEIVLQTERALGILEANSTTGATRVKR